MDPARRLSSTPSFAAAVGGEKGWRGGARSAWGWRAQAQYVFPASQYALALAAALRLQD
jgi:hypothetical protein